MHITPGVKQTSNRQRQDNAEKHSDTMLSSAVCSMETFCSSKNDLTCLYHQLPLYTITKQIAVVYHLSTQREMTNSLMWPVSAEL